MFLKRIRRWGKSLLVRLMVMYIVAFTLMAFISFAIFYYRIYSLTMQQMDSDLIEEVEEFSGLDIESLKNEVAEEGESEDPEEEFYRLYDHEGNVLATTDMAPWGDVEKVMPGSEAGHAEGDYIIQTIDVPGTKHKARMITAPVAPGVILQVGETLEEADEYLTFFQNLLLALMGAMVLVSTLLGWLLARWSLRDMNEVVRTADDISKGAFDRRVRVGGQLIEIEKLSSTFNTMLDRIQLLLNSMKEINDNIAHDLRSPLARIRGIAEMTLVNDKTVDEYKEMAASTVEECDTLIDMINTMLDITEAEAGVNGVEPEEFDLVLLVTEACELFRPIAAEKKIDLICSMPESCLFQGAEKKLQRTVTNLLENAIKYTPEKGTVHVSVVVRDDEVQIVFEDNGIGISDKDLPHIFDRFYRGDQSRSRGGVGLGLSLAKAFAESLRGKIQVNSKLDHGSTFTLKFDR